VTAQATKRFFATVQNKLHWAIHGQTAAEVIVNRADAEKEHMGLTTWKDAPARQNPEIRRGRGQELPDRARNGALPAWSTPISMWPRTWRCARSP
jgi:hypothetical protein